MKKKNKRVIIQKLYSLLVTRAWNANEIFVAAKNHSSTKKRDVIGDRIFNVQFRWYLRRILHVTFVGETPKITSSSSSNGYE